jgi:hypothetical protein
VHFANGAACGYEPDLTVYELESAGEAIAERHPRITSANPRHGSRRLHMQPPGNCPLKNF